MRLGGLTTGARGRKRDYREGRRRETRATSWGTGSRSTAWLSAFPATPCPTLAPLATGLPGHGAAREADRGYGRGRRRGRRPPSCIVAGPAVIPHQDWGFRGVPRASHKPGAVAQLDRPADDEGRNGSPGRSAGVSSSAAGSTIQTSVRASLPCRHGCLHLDLGAPCEDRDRNPERIRQGMGPSRGRRPPSDPFCASPLLVVREP